MPVTRLRMGRVPVLRLARRSERLGAINGHGIAREVRGGGPSCATVGVHSRSMRLSRAPHPHVDQMFRASLGHYDRHPLGVLIVSRAAVGDVGEPVAAFAGVAISRAVMSSARSARSWQACCRSGGEVEHLWAAIVDLDAGVPVDTRRPVRRSPGFPHRGVAILVDQNMAAFRLCPYSLPLPRLSGQYGGHLTTIVNGATHFGAGGGSRTPSFG